MSLLMDGIDGGSNIFVPNALILFHRLGCQAPRLVPLVYP